MKNFSLLVLMSFFTFVSVWGVLPSAGRAEDSLRDNFVAAPSILSGEPLPLKGLPLWHTNGPILSEQIHEFFVTGKENGFGGITFLPLSSTLPPYLSEEYFEKFGEVLETAKANDMKVIFYDDVDFPSGMGGRKLREQFPENTLKRLDQYSWDVTGPTSFVQECPIPLAERAVYGSEAGVLQGIAALNRRTNERINITNTIHENTILWEVPAGDWKVMLFVCVADPVGLVDYMDPQAVRNLMSMTYDAFYRRFPNHFGTTIPMVFFDDITNTGTKESRNWTLGFGEKYRASYDRDPVLDYPALFLPIGEETPAARWRLWSTRNELFADGYPKVVHDWCVEHGLLSSGHPQGPYVLESIDMSGDAMLSHRASDAVLFDSIHYYGHGRDGFKIPTSAAFNYDRDVCVVEIYGNYCNETFDDVMMYRSAMEIFARGGNLLLPHGIWSDPATMYIPPDISWRNPALKGCLPAYGDYVSRCSLLLRGGRHVADLGVLYPIDAIKSFFHFQHAFIDTDYPYGVLLPQETDCLAIGADLTHRIFRDFTFLHPDVMAEKVKVVEKEPGLTILQLDNQRNREEYRVMVLTGADVISGKNMECVLDFYRRGGSVLATTHLPTRSADGTQNEFVQAAIKEIFGLDPTSQAPREALATGQEDITLPESFRKAREINREGEYIAENQGTVVYEDPVCRDRAIFLPRPTTAALDQALRTLLPIPDVALLPAEGSTLPMLTIVPRWSEQPIQGMLQYIHKIKENRNIWFFANSSDEKTEMIVELRGSFQALELWNPHTGEILPVTEQGTGIVTLFGTELRQGTPVTRLRLALDPVTSLFVVEQKDGK